MSSAELTLRMNILGGMNELIKEIGDERIWERWIETMPDEVTEDDLEFIAKDKELWALVAREFSSLSR